MKSFLMLAIFAFSNAAFAAAGPALQDLKKNFGDYIGKYEILECGGVDLQNGQGGSTEKCGRSDAEIMLSYGLRNEDPAEALVIKVENPGDEEHVRYFDLAFTGGHPDDLCYTTPNIQYCDTSDEFDSGIIRFLSQVRFAKDGSDPNIVRVYASLDKQKQPDGMYFHLASWYKLKKKSN
jgi:hypothetical protein